MIALGVVVGAATLVAGLGGAVALRRLRTVRLQLSGLALMAVCLPLAAVLASGLVMFHMGADVAVLAVSAAAASAALGGALIVERAIVHQIDALKEASVALAAGDLEARAASTGPSELRELAASFNAMAETLERTFEARRELVAWASHDLRAPISALQAMLEAIEDGVVAPEHYLETLHGEVRLLSLIVDDLFELARLDSGALTLEFIPTDLRALIESVARRYQPKAAAKELRLETELVGPLMARCAPDKMERVFSNLVENALAYTSSGGRIVISARTGAGAVLMNVEDSGIGISPEAAQRVFEPFWRGDAARTSAEGTGLGLAIAKGVVEAHGGKIWIERPPNGGARVCFLLPAGADAYPEVGPARSPSHTR